MKAVLTSPSALGLRRSTVERGHRPDLPLRPTLAANHHLTERRHDGSVGHVREGRLADVELAVHYRRNHFASRVGSRTLPARIAAGRLGMITRIDEYHDRVEPAAE